MTTRSGRKRRKICVVNILKTKRVIEPCLLQNMNEMLYTGCVSFAVVVGIVSSLQEITEMAVGETYFFRQPSAGDIACVIIWTIIRLSHLHCESLLLRSPRLSSVVCCLPSVCLSRVRSRKLREVRAKFHHPYKKSGSESKNMTSYCAP